MKIIPAINSLRLPTLINTIGVIGILVAGCSNNSDNTATIDDGNMAVPLPQAISAQAIDSSLLRVDVLVTPNGGTTTVYPLNITNVDGTQVRGTLNQSFTPGEYSISLVYYYDDPDFSDPVHPDGLVELMDVGDVTATISSGTKSVVDFTDAPQTLTDSDDDGSDNISELDARTSPFDSLVFPGQTIAPPHNPKITAYQGDFDTEWQDRAGTSSYTVYMDPAQGTPIADKLMTHANAVQPFGHLITIGDSFYVTITSVQETGESLESAEMFVQTKDLSIASTTPAEISVEAHDGETVISWSAVANADFYTVYWSDSPDFSTRNFVPNGNDVSTTTITHSDLQNQTMYFYLVTATVGAIESADSAIVGATPYGRLTPLTGVQILEGDGQLELSWVNPPGTNQTDMYMASDPSVTMENYNSLDNGMRHLNITSAFPHPNLINNLTYYFRFVLKDKYERYSEPSELFSAAPHPLP